MAGSKKYNRRAETYNEESEKYLHITKDNGVPVKIGKDGKVYARGFVDLNDQFEFFSQNGRIYADQLGQADKTTKITHAFDSNKTYSYSQAYFDTLYQSFQNYVFPIREINHKEDPKYIRLNRKTKSLIEGNANDLNTLASFHPKYFVKNNHRYVDPVVHGSWLGPFNYDVVLRVDKTVQKVQDLLVIKSGMFKKTVDDANQSYGVKNVLYTTGVSGHVNVESLSIPQHPFVGAPTYELKSFKFKNSGHSQLGEDATPTPIQSGVVGMFKNGVFAHSPLNGKSYNDSGVWFENSVVSESASFDLCLGSIQNDTTIENEGAYNYKTIPPCVYSINEYMHSPLLGFAKDGFPIYGPVGYSSAGNASSSLKILEPSYRLKQASSRTDGPAFDSTYVSGYYAQDYEYVNALGDLDEHNGRTGVTPEFPNGTYAYFATVDSGTYEPAYPYIVGPTYHGNVDANNGLVSSITESPVNQRISPLSRSHVEALYPNDRIALWEVYGDTHTKNIGLFNEKIIYVSPHAVKEANGIFLKTGESQNYKLDGTAATYNGNKWMATGNGSFLVEVTGYRYPTSDATLFYNDTVLRTGHHLGYINYEAGGSVIASNAPPSVTGTYFYSTYSGHKRVSGKVDERGWNGVIPSGTPFKIETWSFNGDYVGFGGTLSIAPHKHHPLTSGNQIRIVSLATGFGENLQEAQNDASLKARRELVKKNHTLLVKSGVKNENAKMRAWRRMKEKQT